jgi:hypothetical protein
MIRLVGHTDMTMICRVYYHADMQKISEKMTAMKVLDEGPDLAVVSKAGA